MKRHLLFFAGLLTIALNLNAQLSKINQYTCNGIATVKSSDEIPVSVRWTATYEVSIKTSLSFIFSDGDKVSIEKRIKRFAESKLTLFFANYNGDELIQAKKNLSHVQEVFDNAFISEWASMFVTELFSTEDAARYDLLSLKIISYQVKAQNTSNNYSRQEISNSTTTVETNEPALPSGIRSKYNNDKAIFNNNSRYKVSLAVAYYDSNTNNFTSVGWYNIEPNSSFTYNLGFYKFNKLFWYAFLLRNDNIKLEWEGKDEYFCVNEPGPFNINNQSDCSNKKGFYQLVLAPGTTTQDLTYTYTGEESRNVNQTSSANYNRTVNYAPASYEFSRTFVTDQPIRHTPDTDSMFDIVTAGETVYVISKKMYNSQFYYVKYKDTYGYMMKYLFE